MLYRFFYFPNVKMVYYIVYNIEGKYKYYQYKDDKMYKRKVDKYLPVG